jgi:hypothetical protein
VAEFRRSTGRAPVESAVEIETTAYPRAEREHHHVLPADCGSHLGLRVDRQGGVIVQEHGQAQRLLGPSSDGEVHQGEVGRFHHHTAVHVHRARTGDTQPDGPVTPCLGRIRAVFRRCHDRSQEVLIVERAAGPDEGLVKQQAVGCH